MYGVTRQSEVRAEELTNVGSYTETAATKGNQGGFTPRRATRGQVSVARVDRPPEDVVDRLRDHHRGGHVRLDIEHGAGPQQQINQRAVVGGRVIDQGGEPDGGVGADDVKVILDGDGQTVERSNGGARLLEMRVELLGPRNGLVEEDLRQAVCLPHVISRPSQLPYRILMGD